VPTLREYHDERGHQTKYSGSIWLRTELLAGAGRCVPLQYRISVRRVGLHRPARRCRSPSPGARWERQGQKSTGV